ncbi:DEAD/DEAH box helicase, partial [Klebsiella pneumoniae]|uniref:DEAD/DEAH box helicase n=1 Tax=Klebsiella pneumoniae TaxID=573 RepID=UPI003A7FA375
SPLIALMKDQVDQLRARGINAAYVNSSLSKHEREERYAQLRARGFRLVYVTPERFRKPEFVDIIRARQVALLAVDEAHCISDWGHDFRPDYRRIGRILRALDPRVPVLATTATANDRVVE